VFKLFMCVFCNVSTCVWVGFVVCVLCMCDIFHVCLGVCVGSVICGCVCMYEFCNICVWVL
jgi:hypothetical protein